MKTLIINPRVPCPFLSVPAKSENFSRRANHRYWQDKSEQKELFSRLPRTCVSLGNDRPANLSLRAGRALCTVGWPKEALAVTELKIRVLDGCAARCRQGLKVWRPRFVIER